MFIDHAEIYVKAGDGGNGCISFRREKYVPKGGPDGGDGGDGGSVYICARDDLDTLLDFKSKREWLAKRGADGMGKNKYGKKGDDLIINVPTGTIVYDKELEIAIKDLKVPNQKVCVAKGGKGGKGNKHFATSTNQIPRESQEGQPGQERYLKLELKLIADVGLVGLPNAGKSTLLSRISAATPRIASYPFTTLKPSLGIVELPGYKRFVVADIPGLIEGSHEGLGLGHDFLKHIERTRIIVHLVDVSGFDGSDPVKNYHIIRKELASYSQTLADKREIIIASKMDLDPEQEKLHEFEQAMGQRVLGISAVTGTGLDRCVRIIWNEVKQARQDDDHSTGNSKQ